MQQLTARRSPASTKPILTDSLPKALTQSGQFTVYPRKNQQADQGRGMATEVESLDEAQNSGSAEYARRTNPFWLDETEVKWVQPDRGTDRMRNNALATRLSFQKQVLVAVRDAEHLRSRFWTLRDLRTQ